jgi:hypothetical protein
MFGPQVNSGWISSLISQNKPKPAVKKQPSMPASSGQTGTANPSKPAVMPNAVAIQPGMETMQAGFQAPVAAPIAFTPMPTALGQIAQTQGGFFQSLLNALGGVQPMAMPSRMVMPNRGWLGGMI